MTGLDANKAATVAFFEAFSRSDWDGVRALCTPDFQWVVPTISTLQSETLRRYPNLAGERHRSLDETIEGFKLTHDSALDGKFTTRVTTMTAEGDRVAAEGESHAVNKRNGRTYTNRYMFHLSFREGRIREFREYQDTLHLFDVWVAD